MQINYTLELGPAPVEYLCDIGDSPVFNAIMGIKIGQPHCIHVLGVLGIILGSAIFTMAYFSFNWVQVFSKGKLMYTYGLWQVCWLEYCEIISHRWAGIAKLDIVRVLGTIALASFLTTVAYVIIDTFPRVTRNCHQSKRMRVTLPTLAGLVGIASLFVFGVGGRLEDTDHTALQEGFGLAVVGCLSVIAGATALKIVHERSSSDQRATS